jgi:hypothetical protein
LIASRVKQRHVAVGAIRGTQQHAAELGDLLVDALLCNGHRILAGHRVVEFVLPAAVHPLDDRQRVDEADDVEVVRQQQEPAEDRTGDRDRVRKLSGPLVERQAEGEQVVRGQDRAAAEHEQIDAVADEDLDQGRSLATSPMRLRARRPSA